MERLKTNLPKAKVTRFGSVSAALMNVNKPIIPNWSVTICFGMLEKVPKTKKDKDHHNIQQKLKIFLEQ